MLDERIAAKANGVRSRPPTPPAEAVAADTAGPEPRLVLRFMLYAAVATCLAGCGILVFLRHEISDRTNRTFARHAHFLAATVLRDSLRPADFTSRVDGRRRSELDRLFGTKVLVEGAVRVKLWSPTGLVTYSNDHALAGSRAADLEEIDEALHGATAFEIGGLNAEGGTGRSIKTFSVYTPVRLVGAAKPSGVFELYEDYTPVASEVRSTFTPIAAVLVVALLLLYGSLFPILRRVTRALEARNRRLQEQTHALHMIVAAGEATGDELRRTSENYRRLIEATPLALVAIDRNGVVQRWNGAAERLFGWAEHEVIGRPTPIIPPDERPEFRRIRDYALSGETVVGLRVRRRRKDGKEFDVRLSTAPVVDSKGMIVAVIDRYDPIDAPTDS